MIHIFQNMCLTFLDHLIEGLNTRFDKYGSVIPIMHAFIPSVIAVGEEIKRLMKLSTNRWSTRFVLLKTLQTVVVTSSECERSGIVWKRLKTYLWTLIVQNHFSALTLMHINLDVDNDAKRVLKYFAREKRNLSLQTYARQNIT